MNEYQNTPEWFEKKIGKLSASNMFAALHITKDGKDYADRANLKMQILAERLTGLITEHYVNDAMRWGKEQEPAAKDILCQLRYSIEDVGFIDHPIIVNFGASPDGLIESDGLVEIKCPTTQTHLRWLMEGVVPEEHKPQMLAQLACTGRKWVDFISFDPRVKSAAMRIFKRRYEPSPAEVMAIEVGANLFLAEISKMEELLGDAYL